MQHICKEKWQSKVVFLLAGAAFALFALAVQAADEPRFGASVSYGSDPQQTGDLFLPAKVTPETPFVLNIHGGGWSAMSRKDAAGVSAFLVEKGCAVYSVDYRLASKENPWPACGDDCLKAAEFILRGGFAAQGLKPNRIWVIGVSAGGHLALWTGLNLKAEQVAGIISVSGIADPIPDAKANPNRYARLFGGREPNTADFDAMSIMKLVRKNGPRILLTHAREDTVVPVESAANFCNAYRNAGNNILFYQYSAKDEANTGGHAIWRKDWPNGKRLLKCIEYGVAQFMGVLEAGETAENDTHEREWVFKVRDAVDAAIAAAMQKK